MAPQALTVLRVVIWLVIVVLWPVTADAQAENVAKGVDLGVRAAGNIVDQGGLIGSIAIAVGVLSLILHCAQGWAIVSLYKANQDLQEKRAQDAAESTKQVATTAVAGANAITASNERLADAAQRIQTLAERTGALSNDHQNMIRLLDGNSGKMDTLLGRPQPVCRA